MYVSTNTYTYDGKQDRIILIKILYTGSNSEFMQGCAGF